MFYWKPYVPVAKRRANALKEVKKLQKKGRKLSPVEDVGRTITKTFWGNAWCENLEAYSDYANRLPRGRTYVRNGSVVDLQIESCKVNALVSGSSMYRIDIRISKLSAERWKTAKKLCTGSIGSLVELLQGKFSSAVMKSMCNKKTGLFPSTKDITMRCSCPDGALMCKHIAAVLYGVGARLDTAPELLFVLRDVNPKDLLSVDVEAPIKKGSKSKIIADAGLSDLFGIELEASPVQKKISSKSIPKKTGKSKNKAK